MVAPAVVPEMSKMLVAFVKFTPLGRTTGDSLPAGSVATFRITNPNGGACVADGGPMRCLWVAVTAAGQVRMCDPAVAAGDPRAC